MQQQHQTQNRTKGKIKALQVAANLPKTENVSIESGKDTKAVEEKRRAKKTTEEKRA